MYSRILFDETMRFRRPSVTRHKIHSLSIRVGGTVFAVFLPLVLLPFPDKKKEREKESQPRITHQGYGISTEKELNEFSDHPGNKTISRWPTAAKISHTSIQSLAKIVESIDMGAECVPLHQLMLLAPPSIRARLRCHERYPR